MVQVPLLRRQAVPQRVRRRQRARGTAVPLDRNYGLNAGPALPRRCETGSPRPGPRAATDWPMRLLQLANRSVRHRQSSRTPAVVARPSQTTNFHSPGSSAATPADGTGRPSPAAHRHGSRWSTRSAREVHPRKHVRLGPPASACLPKGGTLRPRGLPPGARTPTSGGCNRVPVRSPTDPPRPAPCQAALRGRLSR